MSDRKTIRLITYGKYSHNWRIFVGDIEITQWVKSFELKATALEGPGLSVVLGGYIEVSHEEAPTEGSAQ